MKLCFLIATLTAVGLAVLMQVCSCTSNARRDGVRSNGAQRANEQPSDESERARSQPPERWVVLRIQTQKDGAWGSDSGFVVPTNQRALVDRNVLFGRGKYFRSTGELGSILSELSGHDIRSAQIDGLVENLPPYLIPYGPLPDQYPPVQQLMLSGVKGLEVFKFAGQDETNCAIIIDGANMYLTDAQRLGRGFYVCTTDDLHAVLSDVFRNKHDPISITYRVYSESAPLAMPSVFEPFHADDPLLMWILDNPMLSPERWPN